MNSESKVFCPLTKMKCRRDCVFFSNNGIVLNPKVYCELNCILHTYTDSHLRKLDSIGETIEKGFEYLTNTLIIPDNESIVEELSEIKDVIKNDLG